MDRAKVGTAVFIVRDGLLLMQKRAGMHGIGTWCIPGGHIEFGEAPEQTVIREAKEEVGVSIATARIVAITNDVFHESGKHYVTLWLLADGIGDEEPVPQPGEASEVGWFPLDALPSPLFPPLENLLNGGSMIPFDPLSLP
jgi:8-oxo-dGTP diphosphatase